MYCCKRYRLSRPISAQPKLLLTVHLARNGSIMQYLYMFAPVLPLYFAMRSACCMYEALFLLVKSIALPPPLHPPALLVDPSGQPVAKLRYTSYKLQAIEQCNLTKRLRNKFPEEHFLTTVSTLCHRLASNSAIAVSFSPPLASIFCRAYHFQFRKCLVCCK